MFDNRDTRERDCCCIGRCVFAVIWILSVLLFFIGGVIAGAFASGFVTGAIVPIAIFGIILLLATVLVLFFAYCRCNRGRRDHCDIC